MAGTRSSARLADKNSSPPAVSNENKRKADDSQTSPSKRGRKNTAEQKTIEETLKPQESDNAESKPTEQANDTEQKSAEQEPAEQKPSDQDNKTEEKPSETENGSEMKDDKTFKPGDSFKDKNREGESKEDPEKALKDSRGGPGLNALDHVDKPDLEDPPHVSHFDHLAKHV